MTAARHEKGERGAAPRTTAHIDKADQLLGLAARLMAEQGYHNTSMRDVSRATDCSLAGLYHYFPGKEDLLFQIQHRTFSRLLEEQEAERDAYPEAKPEERMATILRKHIELSIEHTAELKLCAFELHSLTGDPYRKVEEVRRRYYRLVSAVVRQILEKKGRRAGEDEVRQMTLFVFGAINWIFMWYRPERDRSIERLASRLTRLVLRGLVGAGRAAPAHATKRKGHRGS